MKGKIATLGICLWAMICSFFLLMILVGIKVNGSITFFENNKAILNTELVVISLLVAWGMGMLVYHFRR